MVRCDQTGLCVVLFGFHRHTASLLYLSSTVSTFPNKPLHHVGYNILFASPGCSPFSSRHNGTNWTVLKSVTISAAFNGLCLMSIINFATSFQLLVPMCLIVRPVRACCVRRAAALCWSLSHSRSCFSRSRMD